MKPNSILLQLYLTLRFYYAGLLVAVFFVCSWLFQFSIVFPQVVLAIWLILASADFIYLHVLPYKFLCNRHIASRLSNSDYNEVQLQFWHSYPTRLYVNILEELPAQFEARNQQYSIVISSRKKYSTSYLLRPVVRGDYHFGHTICLLKTWLGLVQRRNACSKPTIVKVYPSFLHLRKFQLLAHTAQTSDVGHVRLRKIGHSLEFEHIKEYVSGDDRRSINWKATARKGNMMVNNYVDEKSQQVHCIIDKGRLMKMPFDGMSLMDYAINSTLVLGHLALQKQDRFGMLSFAHQLGEYVPADKKPGQLKLLQETLYRMQTQFWESDYEKLYLQIRKTIKQRSLLLLFTNFESASGMQRQLPYLRQLSRHHLLLVIFFENTELASLAQTKTNSLTNVYVNTIAAKFVHEKKMMVKELQQHGILSILTPPAQLTVQVVNKYLELKNRQAI